jgi:two-component system, cell cycle sensor histidine kinase and response regulator CckA
MGSPLCEFDRICPGRNSVRVEVSCTPFPWEGRELLLINSLDVSERDRRRALHEGISRLRAIFHSIPIGVVQCSSDGCVVESNPAAERLFALSHEELKGRCLHSLLCDEYADRFLRLFENTAEVARETYQAEHRYLNRKNEEGWVRLTASRVQGGNEEPAHCIAILEEVTEYKRAERQLRDAQKMEVIGRLVGGVAHDFNNLLTGIMLYCDLLAAALQEQKTLRYADEIRMAGEQGAALVQQLLAISRQHVVEPRILCLNIKIADTRDLLSRLIGDNLVLCTELDPTLGNVRMDPTQFQQILLNLVLNARDAMPNGGQILVRTSNCDFELPGVAVPPGPVLGVMLTVTDHGCGMSDETRSHLFEPFFTTKAAGRGTGLGLATLHDIVQAAGGRIEVESKLEVGTTFRVILPRVPETTKPTLPEFRYSPQVATETVLVVEDSGTVRQAVCGVLRECGYSVMEAGTGAEALALAGRQNVSIDLLLADLGLPGLSGRAVARRLQTTHPDLLCLYMSGYERETAESGSAGEPVVLFQKPFTGAVLLQKVREILDARRAAPTKNEGDQT